MSTLTKQPCRLIVDGPADGAWQMAVDEVLLDSAAVSGRMTLRFYGWSEPTLSLGYFQDYAERDAHAPSRQCPLVRRQTGGGAIVHDRELTYSLAVPAAHPRAGDPATLYQTMHEALIRTLAGFGLAAQRCQERRVRAGASEPFLCFQRRATGDVLVGGVKVCGSAQRRRRGAILQHGSLLLARSERAPELPGVLELLGRSIATLDLRSAWSDELIGPEVTCEPGELLPAETEAASLLFREKYTAGGWNQRR